MIKICRELCILCMSSILCIANPAEAVDEQPTQNAPSPAQNTTQLVQAAPQPAQETKPYTEGYEPPKLLSADEYCRKVQTNPYIKRFVNTSMLFLEKNNQTFTSYFHDAKIDKANKAVREAFSGSTTDANAMKEVVAQCMFKLINSDYVLFFVDTIAKGDLVTIRSYAPDRYAELKNDWVGNVKDPRHTDDGQVLQMGVENPLMYALFSPSAEAILNEVLEEKLNSFNDFLKKNPEANPNGFKMENQQPAAQALSQQTQAAPQAVQVAQPEAQKVQTKNIHLIIGIANCVILAVFVIVGWIGRRRIHAAWYAEIVDKTNLEVIAKKSLVSTIALFTLSALACIGYFYFDDKTSYNTFSDVASSLGLFAVFLFIPTFVSIVDGGVDFLVYDPGQNAIIIGRGAKSYKLGAALLGSNKFHSVAIFSVNILYQ